MKAYRDETTGRWHTDLPDVFDLICDKLRNREQFSFARYGDGEWNAIYGKTGVNCDGHEYFPDMGRRLKEIVSSKPSYMMGMQPLTVASDRITQIQNDFPGIDWVNADSIHNASIDGTLSKLFLSMNGRDVLFVGPLHLRESDKFFKSIGASFDIIDLIIIPRIDCWKSVHNLRYEIIKKTDFYKYLNPVIIFCASMMSEVLIDEFKEYTCIDLGSVLDPYCNVKSRRYHHKLSI